MELKSSDEELARGTISESRVGEPGNPISVILFHGRRGRQREGAVFSGLLCSSIQNVAQRQRKDDGNAKASMQTAGAMLRVCNSTNKRDRYLHRGRNIRAEKLQEERTEGGSRTDGKVSERDREKTMVRMCTH